MSDRREQQAFNVEKRAYAAGRGRSENKLRSVSLRNAFGRGWDEGQRLAIAARATPEQLAADREVLARLKDAVRNL